MVDLLGMVHLAKGMIPIVDTVSLDVLWAGFEKQWEVSLIVVGE